MIRTAIIEDGVVANVVILDPDSTWMPPEGAILVASDEAGPGDTWDGTVFRRAEIQLGPTTGESIG